MKSKEDYKKQRLSKDVKNEVIPLEAGQDGYEERKK